MREEKFKRRIESLDEVFGFVDEVLEGRTIDSGARFAVKLATEELFTNLVRHNIGGRDHIVLGYEVGDDRVAIHLTDFDVEPFDSYKVEPVDTKAPIEQRRPGGLGLHLVRNVIDKLVFVYDKRTLHITATKMFAEEDVR